MTNWLKRLFGGSGSSSGEAPEPATAPEPPSMPSEPAAPPLADTGPRVAEDETTEDEPA